MFHSKTPDYVKENIRQDMGQPDGKVRLLFCTNAAGMGVNFCNLHNIIHLGPPNDLDTLLQQMGRAGRDGKQSHELILFRMHKKELKDLEPHVIKLLKTKECRRRVIAEAYLSQLGEMHPHLCCDMCEENCDCLQDDCPMTHDIKDYVPEFQDEERIRTVSFDDMQLLQNELVALQCQLATKAEISMVPDDIMHGFTAEVAKLVIDNISSIFSIQDLMQKATIWSYDIALKIINIISSVFRDIEPVNEDSDDDSD
jgi:ATP-dependent DNA helicase RecQ